MRHEDPSLQPTRIGKMSIRHLALLALMGLMLVAAPGVAAPLDQRWMDKVAQMIGANVVYPRSAVVRRESGRAKVKIKISGAGKLLSVDLVQGSGSAILDRESVRIPQKIRIYPIPPGGQEAILTVPIVWKL
jgi:periplasmic protein TonB